MALTIPTMRAEPRRDPDSGDYLLPDPRDGREKRWQRATTLAHMLDTDTFHLDRWRDRKLLEGLATEPSRLQDGRIVIGARTKAQKDGMAELAEELRSLAGASEGSEAGTDMHSVTEWADAGRLADIRRHVSGAQEDDLEAYQGTLDEAGITVLPEYIERVVVNTQVGTAGTLDRIVRLSDGRLVIFDVKTQKTVSYGWLSIAIQLAEYAYADAMEDPPGSGKLAPMPAELDRRIGIVAHMPVGMAECRLWQVDIERGWYWANVAAEVRDANKESKSLGRPYRPLASLPEPAQRDQLGYLIDHAQHPAALEALWRHSQNIWTDRHTEAARRRRAELESAA